MLPNNSNESSALVINTKKPYETSHTTLPYSLHFKNNAEEIEIGQHFNENNEYRDPIKLLNSLIVKKKENPKIHKKYINSVILESNPYIVNSKTEKRKNYNNNVIHFKNKFASYYAKNDYKPLDSENKLYSINKKFNPNWKYFDFNPSLIVASESLQFPRKPDETKKFDVFEEKTIKIIRFKPTEADFKVSPLPLPKINTYQLQSNDVISNRIDRYIIEK